MAQQQGDDKAPTVTVCVIAYNSGSTLRTCLQRLGEQTFRDFEALAGWVETTAELPDAAITGIAWELTESTRTSAVAEVRSRAVKDAVAKATVFAQSIGLRQVRAIALADPGMLGDQTGGGAPTPMVRAAMLASDAAPQLTLKPEQLAVTAVVDARFVAS